jgi:type I restriction enzyme, S subunit
VIADLRPYPEYKDSGLPWLGQVPRGWDVKRAKSIFQRLDRRSTTGKEELLTVSSARGIVPRHSETVTMFKAESYLGYKLCWPGDLVINSLWAWAGGLGVSRHHGIISSAYGVYRTRQDVPMNPAFIHEVVRSSAFNWELRVRSKGVWISRLQLTDIAFLDAPVPIPPPSEQAAIVTFLDWVNGRLNRAVRAKRKVITLLNEQKRAIIDGAVTRGLDPSVPLKPSGIPWLGDIPRHWVVRRLKFVASHIVDCLHATPRYSETGTYPAIRTADITPGVVYLDKTRKVSATDFARWTERLTPAEGDILYSREGERFGIAACVPEGVQLCISQRMMVFRIAPQHCSRFVMWLLNSRPTYGQALQDVTGATAPHVNISTIRNYSLAMPPVDEQREIARHIQLKTASMDETMDRINREIELLREYQARLVADVVTGKLDVRDFAKQLSNEPVIDINTDDIDQSDESEAIDEVVAL